MVSTLALASFCPPASAIDVECLEAETDTEKKSIEEQISGDSLYEYIQDGKYTQSLKIPTYEWIPIKKEGILTDIDNTAEKLKKLEGKTFKGVELYGDETFDELKYIDENGVHPRDLDPREGFAEGGIISLIGLLTIAGAFLIMIWRTKRKSSIY